MRYGKKALVIAAALVICVSVFGLFLTVAGHADHDCSHDDNCKICHIMEVKNMKNEIKHLFDCVLKRSGDRYDFYECKYYDRPMTLEECDKEKEQLEKIQGIEVSGIGFVCSGGFSFDDEKRFDLIDGAKLYME